MSPARWKACSSSVVIDVSGRCHGFSLVELLAVLAVVAILAALAVPAYGRYTYRARRIDGKALLWRVVEAQERYYVGYNRYGELSELGFAAPVRSEKGFYEAELRMGEGVQSFVVAVRPVAGQVADVCGGLMVDEVGRRGPGVDDEVANGNGVCW